MRRLAALALLALLATAGAGQAAEEVAAPASGSALDELFPDGLPFPFERVLDRLRAEAGQDAVRTALIPLGRSLQRYSAAPDYFGSPRIVVAVTGDRARGPEMPRLADRLYLGYVPAAAVVEAISYDESAGRFEFEQIVGYGLEAAWRVEVAERSICLRCHQGEAPIFARPLWSESNANPAVVSRLEGIGGAFHGAPVRQSVDALDAFDASTDRAARIAVANRLWVQGCPDAACRAELFLAALRFGLNGFRSGWSTGQGEAAAAFAERASVLWPDGLSVVSPDLPNRDPAPMLASADPGGLLETEGELDPETPRARVVLWRPNPGGFDAAAREMAAMLSPGDFAWLDALLQGQVAVSRSLSLTCAVSAAPVAGQDEIRFDCGGGASDIGGFLRAGTGRIDRLTIDGADAPARIPVRAVEEGGAYRLEATGAAPRLPDGARIGSLTLSGPTMRLEVVDDLTPLAAALEQSARASSPAFAPVPFRRQGLLTLIADILGGQNG